MCVCVRVPQVWEDAVRAKCEIDSRLCTTLIEVCGRKGDTDRAIRAYQQVRRRRRRGGKRRGRRALYLSQAADVGAGAA